MVAHSREPRAGHPVLDIGEDLGAVVFYTASDILWQEIEIAPVEAPDALTHTDVTERRVGTEVIYTGVFPPLAIGEYRVRRPTNRAGEEFIVARGQVTYVDWRPPA